MTPKIKFQRLVDHAALPKRATPDSAGYDVVATDYYYDHENQYHEYGLGLAANIPKGWQIDVRPRSSISKTSLVLVNAPGTIDSDYTKEILVRFKVIDDREVFYKVGDRVAQFIFKQVPDIELEEVEEVVETDRGGFGSTGQ